MSKYGQFCPIARSLEILGDRWTLLIIRDLLTGTTHFNDLERGLPGISRAILARRLRQLQLAGVIEKQLNGSGRQTTKYGLTQAGQELLPTLMSLRSWGETWAFGEPTQQELDPVLLMWWLRGRAKADLQAGQRIVVPFNFHIAKKSNFWLLLTAGDTTLCLTDPGFEISLLVTAELALFFKLWAGRVRYQDALHDGRVTVDGVPDLVDAFPSWFGWNKDTAAVRSRQASVVLANYHPQVSEV